MEKIVLKNKQVIEKISDRNSIKIIFLLILASLIIRIYFTPFHIPISLDGIDYFAYAVAMSREGTFPTGYLLTNFGWPSFVSMFFAFNQNADMLTLMNLQRILSIIISTSTIIPIFLLAKIFFKKEIAILGSTLFLFDPRIIENSILGITDTLFILLTVLTILFIFYKKGSWVYLSFIFVALAAFVRYEGILLIIPLVISMILKNKEKNFSYSKIIIGVLIFLMMIIPLNLVNYQSAEQSSIFTQIIHRGYFMSETIINNEFHDDEYFGSTTENNLEIFVKNAVGGFIKYVGWTLIPTFIVFCILGVIFIPKTISKNRIIFVMFFVFLSLSSIFAYGRGIQDTRYILILLPIFTMVTCYGFNYLLKYDWKKLLPVIVISIIVSSIIFIEYRNSDYTYEAEMYDATLFLVNIADGVNNYHDNKFVKVADLQNNWPELLPKGENDKMKLLTKKFKIEEFDQPLEFIKSNENKGLTHLLIKEGDKEGFFDDIFENEENYPFLEKIYDSKDFNKNTEYKIFKINYERIK